MRRYPEATPCPVQNLSFPSRYTQYAPSSAAMYAPSYAATDDNTTANIEYTTEIQAGLRNAKPRRPMRASRKSTFNPGMDIFEDVAHEEEEQQRQQQEAKRRSRASIMPRLETEKRSTILGQPAQKISIPPAITEQIKPPRTQRRRVSQILMNRQAADMNATVQLREDVLERRERKAKKEMVRENQHEQQKKLRRRTIFIPDDTTVMTIHPGQSTNKPRSRRERSPDIGLDLVTVSDEEPGSIISAPRKDKTAPRKSLAVPPKRGPLQQSTRPLQGTSFSEDIYGKGGGKENVPPGVNISFNFGKDEAKKPVARPTKGQFSAARPTERPPLMKPRPEGTQKRPRSHLSCEGSPAKSAKTRADSTAPVSRKPAVPTARDCAVPKKPTPAVKERAVTKRTTATTTVRSSIRSRIAEAERAKINSSPFQTDRSPPSALRRHKQSRASTQISMLHVVGRPQEKPAETRRVSRDNYEVLSEDLTKPELYEEHWLTYQEVAVTQFLNSLFESASAVSDAEQSIDDVRSKMLALYQDPAIPLLHKRLQASLQFGALAIPKDLLAQTLRVKDDVGLRKKFLNLWVKTYDLAALRAAAETIIGRKITAQCRLSSGSTCSDDGSRQFRAERRAVEGFLDTFLIRNEDAVRVKSRGGSIASITRGDHNNDEFGSPSWTWRRTMLRSLMLILILDKAKAADVVPGCLFQTTSPHKTSEQVLYALSKMLLPSVGDVARPLGHFNYKVSHTQFPLEEYTYHIENIAIDLRDGVILTRLVELLLYPPTKLAAERDESVTITMPTGEVLTSNMDFHQKESWVLSQHLKYPAIGRPQKLYNVQIALSALTGVRGIPVQAVDGVKPEDIVDGHREKTISLLWALVSKYGLSTFVDWPQIVKEIERFREAWYSKRDECQQGNLDSDVDDDCATEEVSGLAYHTRLLLTWSRAIARLHGHRITNLTTSFANPKVLECIVDMYLPSSLVSPTIASNAQLSLPAKLKATGCSISFIALFASQSQKPSTIPSKDFTLLTLSFLASRLLPLSLKHRAAATIQRAWRVRLARQMVRKRIVAMTIAREAADVARKRERLVGAAIVMQRCWRGVLERRQRRLEVAMEGFQALARGWAVRRWVRRLTGKRERVRRIRGGW